MSKEYIEREAVLSIIRQALEKGLGPSLYIKRIPAADVAPVVHASWIGYETESWRHGSPKRRKYYRCSNCRTASAVRHKACPNCRAIMDADTQERGGAANDET